AGPRGAYGRVAAPRDAGCAEVVLVLGAPPRWLWSLPAVTATSLLELPLLAGLSAAEAGELVGRLDVAQGRRGTYLFRRGDPGDSLYVVASGQVALELPGARRPPVPEVRGPGDWVGAPGPVGLGRGEGRWGGGGAAPRKRRGRRGRAGRGAPGPLRPPVRAPRSQAARAQRARETRAARRDRLRRCGGALPALAPGACAEPAPA